MRNVCFSLGFPGIFAYGPSVFVLLFWPFFLLQSVRFGTPKRSKIDPQIASKSRPDFDTAKGPNLLRFGCPLGSPKSPQNRSSDPLGAPGGVLVASAAAWGCIDVSSCPFWVLLGPFGPPRGAILAPFGSLMGPFWPHQGSIWLYEEPRFELSLVSKFCTTFWNTRPGGVRGSALNLYIHI